MNYNSFAPSDPVGWSAAPLVPSHSLLLLPQISSVFFPAVRPFITQHSPLWLFSFYSQPRPPLCFYPFLILSLTSTAKGVFSFQTGAEKELWQGAEREGLSVYVCVLALPAMQPQEVHCASPPPSLYNNDMSTSQSGLDNMRTRGLTGTQIFQMDHSWNTLCKNVCRQIVPFRKKQNKTKHFKQERRLQVCPSKSDTVFFGKVTLNFKRSSISIYRLNRNKLCWALLHFIAMFPIPLQSHALWLDPCPRHFSSSLWKDSKQDQINVWGRVFLQQSGFRFVHV